MQGILHKKYNEYAVIGLFINQDTDNLIKVTDRNRKKILQELIESLLKEKKRTNMVIALNFTTPKAMKKLSL